ncbi:unnamed protein product [Lota lota]
MVLFDSTNPNDGMYRLGGRLTAGSSSLHIVGPVRLFHTGAVMRGCVRTQRGLDLGGVGGVLSGRWSRSVSLRLGGASVWVEPRQRERQMA